MASRNRALAIKTPVETLLRVKDADRGAKETLICKGDVITLLNQTGKQIEQFKARNIVSSGISLEKINKDYFTKHAENVANGYNLLVLSIGTSQSGKDKLIFGNKRPGLISLFLEQVSMECQSSFHTNNHQNLDFFFEVRAVEIIEERVIDLLNQSLPSTCTLVDNVWEGVVLERSTAVRAENFMDLTEKINLVAKNRTNFLSLVSGEVTKTACFITVSVIQEYKQNNKRATLCSKVMFAQLPGLEVLKNNQMDLRAKESHRSIKGVVTFSSLIRELSDESEEVSPLYEVSNLTYVMKEFLGSNAHCVSILNATHDDPAGTLKTLTCLRSLGKVSQYPIVNEGSSLGLMFRIRTDLLSLKVPEIREKLSEIAIASERVMNSDSNNDKLRAEDDYKRVLTKYREVKTKLEENVKKKSDLQLLLIRSEEEKLELSKTLVEIQIENARLLEQNQFKEYNMGKKTHKLEGALHKKEQEKTRNLETITDYKQRIADLEEEYRDLQVEFVALKKNYLMGQKDLEQSRKETQKIQLDYININNQNKYLQDQLFRGTKDERERYQLEQIAKYQQQIMEVTEREAILKREVQQLRKELSRSSQSSSLGMVLGGKSGVSEKSGRTELQNQKMELRSRQKITERRVQELEEHVRMLNEDIEEYKSENSMLTDSLSTASAFYKNKLQEVIRTGDTSTASKGLNNHLNSQLEELTSRVSLLNKRVEKLKTLNRGLRVYALQLKTLAEEYMPRGLQLPQYLSEPPSENQNLNDLENNEIVRLNDRIRTLQNQLRSRENSNPSMTNQRLQQEISFLKDSRVGTPHSNADDLRRQRNDLREQNRKLTGLLKQGNKLQMASVMKDNQQLRGEVEKYRGKESVSPVSNDQKIVYYEKHIKKLERERSELLVRVTMAEEQLSTYQKHYEGKKK